MTTFGKCLNSIYQLNCDEYYQSFSGTPFEVVLEALEGLRQFLWIQYLIVEAFPQTYFLIDLSVGDQSLCPKESDLYFGDHEVAGLVGQTRFVYVQGVGAVASSLTEWSCQL